MDARTNAEILGERPGGRKAPPPIVAVARSVRTVSFERQGRVEPMTVLAGLYVQVGGAVAGRYRLDCPRCGMAALEPAQAGGRSNLLCLACGTCWAAGEAERVDPTTCPGCGYGEHCRLPHGPQREREAQSGEPGEVPSGQVQIDSPGRSTGRGVAWEGRRE